MDRNEEMKAFIQTRFPVWEQGFDQYLRENTFARAALDSLLAAGCQRRTVTGLLFPYCCDSEPLEARLKSERWQALSKKFARLASELDEAGREVKDLCEGDNAVQSIASQLRAEGEFLKLCGPAIKGKAGLRHSFGRSFYLVRLSVYIRAASEGDYFDGKLAYLVEAGFSATGKVRHFDGNRVMKLRHRLKERNPLSYEKLELDAAEYFAEFGREGDPELKPSFLEWSRLR